MENIVYRPPIAKTTNELLRNMLLSTDRNKFNRSKTSTSFTTSNNNSYYNYYQVHTNLFVVIIIKSIE